jgi:UDP-glucose 4-epimerase
MIASTFLITGGSGFIGSHLTMQLVGNGHQAIVLDNFSTSSRSAFEVLISQYRDSIEIIEGDIRSRSDCKRAAANADYVLHHAAMASVPGSIAHPDECIAVNVLGTTNLLEEVAATGKCRRFVLASSSAVYGELLPVTKSEKMPLDPLSPYATSKLCGELLCRNFSYIHGLPTVSLRYFNVFGERQDPNGPYAAVIPQFIKAILAEKPPTIFGDGEQSRDFVSVADVVLANIRACESDADKVSGKSFNIGSGRQTTLNDLITVLSRIMGLSVTPNYLPARVGDIKHSLSDISLARELLGYSPAVSLEKGLQGLVAESNSKLPVTNNRK